MALDLMEMFQNEMVEFRKEMKGLRIASEANNVSLARIEASIKPFFDNGQPGIITRMRDELEDKADQEDVDDHEIRLTEIETGKIKQTAFVAGVSAAASALGTLIVFLIKRQFHLG